MAQLASLVSALRVRLQGQQEMISMSPMAPKRGLTLLEVMITLIILVIGVIGLLQVFSTVMIADADVENTTTALYLAQEKMEEIRNAASYAAIDSYAATRANIGGAFADFDRAVTVSGSPKQVNVIVYWTTKGSGQNINLVSLFTDYDY